MLNINFSFKFIFVDIKYMYNSVFSILILDIILCFFYIFLKIFNKIKIKNILIV